MIPTCNRNSKSQRVVDSVLRQTYENRRLYVINRTKR
ncbi:glycosyltransferase family A protein [Halorubrum sp. CBA1125]